MITEKPIQRVRMIISFVVSLNGRLPTTTQCVSGQLNQGTGKVQEGNAILSVSVFGLWVQLIVAAAWDINS